MDTSPISPFNALIRALTPVVLILAAMFLMTQVIGSESNNLAALCKYLAIVLFIVATCAPRYGLILMLFSCAYLDLLKRLLILWGSLDYLDLVYVLGITPAIIGGLSLSLLGRWIVSKEPYTRLDTVLLGIISILVGVGAVVSIKHGQGYADTLKDIANGGFYAMLLLLGSKLRRDADDCRRMCHLCTLIFLPVALYGIYQSIFGLSGFEIDYLRSGLTIMIKELDDIRPRPFSTLNSSGALSCMCTVMAVLSLLPLYARENRPPWNGSRLRAILLASIYIIAFVCTFTRSFGLVLIGSAAGMFCFRTSRRTIALYGGAFVLFVTLLFSAQFLLDNLAVWDPSQYMTSDVGEQAFRIQTYSDRLKGFINLTGSSDMYSLFGLPESMKESATTGNHDGLSQLLVNYGLIPLMSLIVFFSIGIYLVHRKILSLPLGGRRNLAITLLSLSLSILATEILVGFVLVTFPINLFFWLFNGSLVLLLFREPVIVEEEAVQPLSLGGYGAISDNNLIPAHRHR